MSLGGSTKGGSGTQTTEPWSEQKPYLIKGFQEAGNLYQPGNRPQYYQGNTVAPVSSYTTNAGDIIAGRANNNRVIAPAIDSNVATVNGAYLGKNPGAQGGPFRFGANSSDPYYQGFATGDNAVSDLTIDTASGAYLNSNPYIDAMYGKAANAVKQQYGDAMLDTQSAFSRAGRYGSGNLDRAEERNSETLSKGLGDLATDIYGNNYANERGLMETAQGRAGDWQLQGTAGLASNFASDTDRRMQSYNADKDRQLQAYSDERKNMLTATGMAPELEAGRYIGADKMMNYGQYMDDYNQDTVNADIDRWDFEQNSAQQAFNNYMAAIQGNYGGTTTSKSRQSGLNFSLPLLG